MSQNIDATRQVRHDAGSGQNAGYQRDENVLQGWLDLQRVWV